MHWWAGEEGVMSLEFGVNHQHLKGSSPFEVSRLPQHPFHIQTIHPRATPQNVGKFIRVSDRVDVIRQPSIASLLICRAHK